MTAREQLIKRMRLLEQDHKPDGYPAVQMRDISALLDMLEADGVPVAWLNLKKLSPGGMAYATSFKANEQQVPLYTAPQPAIQAERVPLTSEQAIAMREAHQIGASDAWFKARYEGLDTRHSRNIFEAGFNRGWDAAHGIGADK